ncbi:response regulator [Spirosoma sp.]|uniref:response regulator n=1 Tax=Spirosoma sp. TaxID=1899569 RepID=UPI003B3A5EF0
MVRDKYVCVVEDKADLRFILKRIFALSFPDYPIHLFEHGQALLDELVLTQVLPTLILMDRHMPVLDGYQTLCQLKQNPAYQPVPVVMMSADASSAEIRELFQAGANSFIRKPIEFSAQMEMIAQVGQYWLQTNQNA